ncbi:hypothetical protein [Burkholderia sp. THE68]|uniref:hypothetical protein n=1 Tax=Burkholderia sp. THE68 TaxID=758782 RepID=UPI00138A27F7|nr:hypothetical protein [Burkholderia sp. THE68]
MPTTLGASQDARGASLADGENPAEPVAENSISILTLSLFARQIESLIFGGCLVEQFSAAMQEYSIYRHTSGAGSQAGV